MTTLLGRSWGREAVGRPHAAHGGGWGPSSINSRSPLTIFRPFMMPPFTARNTVSSSVIVVLYSGSLMKINIKMLSSAAQCLCVIPRLDESVLFFILHPSAASCQCSGSALIASAACKGSPESLCRISCPGVVARHVSCVSPPPPSYHPPLGPPITSGLPSLPCWNYSHFVVP